MSSHWQVILSAQLLRPKTRPNKIPFPSVGNVLPILRKKQEKKANPDTKLMQMTPYACEGIQN